MPQHAPPNLPARLSRTGAGLARRLQDDTFSGALLLGAAVLALVWANSPWRETYFAIAGLEIGPAALHLDLSLSTWAADGLLAIFFFVVGLELKTEFVTGSLRKLDEALLPMIAAVLGMAAPALIYTGVQLATGSGATSGWAIPTATDIAFAVALLGIFGRGLPPALRVFLLTLAVVDDLLAITVIAVFYTEEIQLFFLLGSLALIGVFASLVQRRITAWWVLVPVAVVAWALMHEAGVHATVAGVLMGMVVPARRRRGEDEQLTHAFVEKVQPLSAGFALPVFAFFAAGVSVVDSGGLGEVVSDPVAIGVIAGLVLGKSLGIWGGVAILVRTTRLRLGHGVDLADLLGVAMLAGIGFTVSLLIADLSFGASTEGDHAKFAVILGSVISAVLGAITLRLRARVRVRGRGGRGR
ncbi:Na+/H+ antiporter NhaA [Georgenia subflava]|uniref:Na(+)/H(+) antiporter NhaA n=1 Tax=Georgenia subflava TaxID=1622177 RepID=A0A6N7ET44_9MICO|nr:Na+/H+ antiporter NhaA [Georgenia subflava]MPV38344.1 Na+/H+ antiporter NhaA [Georgenia subflava]